MSRGPTTQVLSEDLKVLNREFGDFRLETSRFQAQVTTQLAFIKWLGAFFAGILVALFAGTVNLAWNASALNSEVRQQGTRIEQLLKSSEVLDKRLGNVEGRLGNVQTSNEVLSGRLGNIEAQLKTIVDGLKKRTTDGSTSPRSQNDE